MKKLLSNIFKKCLNQLKNAIQFYITLEMIKNIYTKNLQKYHMPLFNRFNLIVFFFFNLFLFLIRQFWILNGLIA